MYKYDADINLIKKTILEKFNKNVYDYKETKEILKSLSKDNRLLNKLLSRHSNTELLNHLIRSSIFQLKKEKKIIKHNYMNGFYILDDFDPISKFIELEIKNNFPNNVFFINTSLSFFLKQDNEAILPNLKKICLPSLFAKNPDLLKYCNVLRKYFPNYIFISTDIDKIDLKEFIMTFLELSQFKGIDSIPKDYLKFIKSKYFSLFSIKLNKEKMIDIKCKNISLNVNNNQNYLMNIFQINNENINYVINK